ncbi:hypothetical protein TNCV_3977441 [Trichonephila clavipes]|nr:hypothetical protein TNCV_3977441 [Trichonephila clavipes]
MGSGGSPQYIAPGVNAFLGTVPLNVNWDVEQDFSNIHGQKGNVDPEGFAQHPSTKTIRPGDKKKPSFVWRFPRSFRQFYETNQVTTAISQTSITDFMQGLSGLKNLRAPSEIIYSIPKFMTRLCHGFLIQELQLKLMLDVMYIWVVLLEDVDSWMMELVGLEIAVKIISR